MIYQDRHQLAGLLRWLASKLDPPGSHRLPNSQEVARLHFEGGVLANRLLAAQLGLGEKP